MKKFLFVFTLAALAQSGQATVLTSIPGPDAQPPGESGMIMPMVMLNEGTKTLSLMFDPYTPPLLAPLTYYSPGDSFAPGAVWYSLLNPAPGGAGALFSNRFGFSSMSVTLPSDRALAIRLASVSSGLMEFWNYVDGDTFFDEVFTGAGDQVLWDGVMWHNYFTLPSSAAPGTYTASFEVFVANATFTSGTGHADYTAAALAATRDMFYNTVTIDYTWQAIPEPSTYLLLISAGASLLFIKLRRVKQRNS